MHTITVLIPAYNEEILLEGTTRFLYNYLTKLKGKIISDFEIIICINASTDKTEEIAKRMSNKYSEVRHFSIDKKGMGIALTEGLKRAKNDIITFIGADAETLPDFIEKAVPLMDKYDLINCSRYLTKQPHGSSFIRTFLSYSFREYFRIMFKYKFSEVGSVKVFTRDSAKMLLPHLKQYDGTWQMDVLYHALKLKLKISEVPLNMKMVRPASESKARLFHDSWAFFKICFKYGIKNYLHL